MVAPRPTLGAAFLLGTVSCGGGDTVRDSTCDDLPWSQVVAGSRQACGIHTDGCAECWGIDGSDAFYEDTGWTDYADQEAPSVPLADLSIPVGTGFFVSSRLYLKAKIFT